MEKFQLIFIMTLGYSFIEIPFVDDFSYIETKTTKNYIECQTNEKSTKLYCTPKLKRRAFVLLLLCRRVNGLNALSLMMDRLYATFLFISFALREAPEFDLY